jgi:hypothetical protein
MFILFGILLLSNASLIGNQDRNVAPWHNFRFAGFQRASMLVNCMEHSWRRHRGNAFTDEQHLPSPRIELTLRH